jgi:Protein of unknown function (DUF1769)
MTAASQFSLKVTAGASYDSHTAVPVNSNTPLAVQSERADVSLLVRIKDFRPPNASSQPENHPYFSQDSRNGARFSIVFRLVPKKNINGNALLLGNDFDEPIRDLLPPFFGTGLQIVKRLIDPGIDGDPHGDKPYLFGPLLSSANVMRIGGELPAGDEDVLAEGAEGDDAEEERSKLEIPSEAAARQKWFLDEHKRKEFIFEKGTPYDFDFFNGYLDFNGM